MKGKAPLSFRSFHAVGLILLGLIHANPKSRKLEEAISANPESREGARGFHGQHELNFSIFQRLKVTLLIPLLIEGQFAPS
jgi:hypothetical protein